jgi:hypothetical protein
LTDAVGMVATKLRAAALELAANQEMRISKSSLASLLSSIADWQEARYSDERSNSLNDVVLDAHLLADSILKN